MQHLVKKQIINLRLSKQTDAFQMQQQMSTHYKQDVLPLLEKVFDKLSGEEETWQIDKLEIDLGILSETQINKGRWDDDILSIISKQLYDQVGEKERSALVNREPAELNCCRQWLFYMQNGYLPWNGLYINEAWYDKVLEALAIDFASVAELRKIIRENPVVSKRIILQHDESFLIKLTEILTAASQRELAAAVDALLQLILSPISRQPSDATVRPEEWRRKIWEQALQLAASHQGKLTTEQLTEEILIKNISYHTVSKIINAGNVSTFAIILPVLKKLYEKPGLFSEDASATDTGRQNKEEKKETKPDNEIDEEGIFVQHAGMVLIHPFLSSFFKRLQLVSEGKFLNTEVQQKAIYLLHYIATGATAAHEYELVVPKVLCEWPLQMPVEKDIEINEDELKEADNMLQAAIDQWTVLKNTSVAGLRESFLQRKGKLFTKNDNLHLLVETNSIDPLLDQLPWNLSMIKLPWMKKILRVEWR